MPLTGRLRSTVYVPGELFSVNPMTVDAIDGLFARNERVVSFFDTDLGPLAITMIGAVFVGCIEQVWRGVVTPPRRREALIERYDDTELVLEQGCEMGRFYMGSTVIMMLANPTVEWSSWMAPGLAGADGAPHRLPPVRRSSASPQEECWIEPITVCATPPAIETLRRRFDSSRRPACQPARAGSRGTNARRTRCVEAARQVLYIRTRSPPRRVSAALPDRPLARVSPARSC